MAEQNAPKPVSRSEQLRETTKWLMTIFGAVGAALIAGLQLTGLGNVTGIWLLLGLLGFTLAIIGVAFIIWQLTQVFSAGVVNRNVLISRYAKTDEDGKTIESPIAGVVGGIVVDDQSFFRNRPGHGSLRAFFLELEKHQISFWKKSEADLKLATTKREIDYYTDVSAEIVHFASQGLVVEQFNKSIAWSFVGFVVAAIGIVLFAVSVGQKQPIVPATGTAYTVLNMSINVDKQPAYTAFFGKDCVASPLQVIIVGESPDRYDLISVPSSTCTSARVTMPKADAAMAQVAKP